MNGSSPRLDIQFFPQEMIDLHTEVRKHPELLRILHEQENKDVYIQLLEIATYCNVLVVGDFTHQDILDLATQCTKILMSKRVSIIIPYH
jgi:hypothetical protein